VSGASFDHGPGAISKAEKVAWLQFALLTIATTCLGWLWWSSWPDGEVLLRNAAVFERWPSWLMVVAIACVALIKLRGRREPLEDERDRGINGAARAHGFAALALMNVLLYVAVRTEGLLQDHLTPEWLALAIATMLVVAFLTDAVYRLARYRWN
jgi:hypothetical protein